MDLKKKEPKTLHQTRECHKCSVRDVYGHLAKSTKQEGTDV